MNNYQTIEIEEKEYVKIIWLNRPAIHNAFNEILIKELLDVFKSKEILDKRAVIIRGRGKSFCAGADLNWMKSVVNYEFDQNLEESNRLSECFYAIYSSAVPTIAYVHGNAIGGANGILSACDIVYADPSTKFSLSEVKIGLTPACISPYILKRIGEFKSRELMLTGRRFDGNEAKQIGLVNHCIDIENINEYLDELVRKIVQAGPEAVKVTKVLIDNVVNNLSFEAAQKYTAEIIANLRQSDEGQEGMNAFLEKRKPAWYE